MTTQHNSRYSTNGRSGGRLGPFLLGILFTLLGLVGAAWVYLHYGHPPVAAADPAFPMEAQIVHVPLGARIQREMAKPPFGTSEDVFETGAKIYATSCAECHGTIAWTISEFRHPPPTSLDCAQCHQAPPSHYMEHFKMIDQQICGQPNAKVNQCFLCHQTTAWNDIKGVGFYKHH